MTARTFMNHVSSSRRKAVNRSVQPKVDNLEDRMLLYAAIGGSWQYPQRITYSLVPDGTTLSSGTGSTSNLFATMNAKFPGVNWQAQIQRAAAVWEAVTNINLVQVSDNGTSLGGGSNQQGDSNFGDIRIGGTTTDLTSSQLGLCYKLPPSNGGSIAGDIVLNDNQGWQINANTDLQTVMIHEFGHALGLDHSTVSAADMYATYNNIKQTLSSDDISGIQSIYGGARQSDSYEGTSPGNYNSANATSINTYLNSSNNQVMLPQTNTGAYPDITTSSDQDWYKVTVPSTGTLSGSMVVQMQSANLSSLSPRVQVYNSSNQSLGIATAATSYGSTVTVTVTGVTAGQVFYIKASAANSGPDAVGAYALNVNFGSSSTAATPIPSTTVAAQTDVGGGSLNDILTADTAMAGTARLAPTVRLTAPGDTNYGANTIVNLDITGLLSFASNGSINLNAIDNAIDQLVASISGNKKTSSSTVA